MKIVFFSAQIYEQEIFTAINHSFEHQIDFVKAHLNSQTVKIAEGYSVACCFVNDDLSADIVKQLAQYGIKLIALRSAGYNHLDCQEAKRSGITVVRVPAYSPYAVAEHAAGLILTLNRKIHRAYHRTREGDFSLHGLMGYDLHGKTVGIIGTGKIGSVFAKIMSGFGCKIVAYDVAINEACRQLGVEYVNLADLYRQADIISLHCPLTPDTYHMINTDAFQQMKHGVMLINTSRGGVIDTKATIQALKSGKLANLGIDVYEEEGDIFFENLSDMPIQDDVLARLLTFPNVIVTGHQGFFTREALENIAKTTLSNIQTFFVDKRQIDPKFIVV